ncbi:MAG TPA: MarR family transcriptional regulator [Nocardioides sp.]|nr:MarR family transcriptional regulator [Nocardioides sp.]
MDPDVPSDSLGEAFGAVARRLRSASMAAFAAYDVTPSQVRAIRVLDTHGGVRSKELADHLRIAPRSTTEVVDALEAKGLVSRSADPHDRRATLVALTDRGRELSAEVRRARGVESERMFERLTPTDRADLARILGKLSEEHSD